MSASLHLLSLTPQSLSLFNSTSFAAAPSILTSFSLKPLQKLTHLLSTTNYTYPSSRFVPRVAISSELDEVVEEDQSFSPELKVFVGNLSFNVDSAALAGLFEQAGNVEMVEVIYDKLSGRSRGFGFVTMSTIQEVEAAAQQFNGYEFHGRVLRVNYGPAPPKRENSPSPFGVGSSSDNSNRVYVGNLSWGVDNVALETLFSQQGKVQEARVVYDRESGRSRGFGFVTYNSPDEVNSAIQSLDGADLDGRSIRVSAAESRQRTQY